MAVNAEIILWGTPIGAVTWVEERNLGIFQYTPGFLQSGIELSPLKMPSNEYPYEFPDLARKTFKGLPGLLADSLPDKFGNAVINTWLASNGRTPESFNPVERLCCIGNRGMGALEFKPAMFGAPTHKKKIEIQRLVAMANRVLDDRANLAGTFSGIDDRNAIEDILRVGTSAGGARAKAILDWNPETNVFRSGQVKSRPGFEHWLVKFDGVSNNRDKELADPQGYGKIEFAYHLMARQIGINMAACRLHHEGGRSHFMTRRFDRTPDGDKVHMQTLGAMAHFDYNRPADYSYEQAILVIRQLGLPREDLEQQVLRAMFNIIARNQDDHVKNIAFLMDRTGQWRLSPAHDVTYAWDPRGDWTSRHQMSLNNKRDGFTRDDLVAFAMFAGIKKPAANKMVKHVLGVVSNWPQFAKDAGVERHHQSKVKNALRLDL